MTSYNSTSALTEEILAKKNQEQQSGEKKIGLKNGLKSSLGEGEVVVWRRANVSVSDIVALFSSLESSRKQLDDVNNDDSSCNSDNTDGDYQIRLVFVNLIL